MSRDPNHGTGALPPPDKARREGETREQWMDRIRDETTRWIDEHGDDPCPECGNRPITESHLVGCSSVRPA